MEQTIYVVTHKTDDETYLIKSYESKNDARQELEKQTVVRDGTWEKLSQDSYFSESPWSYLTIQEMPLTTDEADPRQKVRW
jgi:hypothetical protein